MKKYLVIIILVIYSTIGRAQTKLGNGIATYPEKIRQLSLQRLYDSTKWVMYCMLCDVPVPFKKETGITERITYGSLPLKFDTLIIHRDTVEINFLFYYEGREVDTLVERLPLWGKVFIGKSQNMVRYSSRGETRYFTTRGFDPKRATARHINPRQPAVIKYIKENQAKLDPWFYNEAKKRGVIK